MEVDNPTMCKRYQIVNMTHVPVPSCRPQCVDPDAECQFKCCMQAIWNNWCAMMVVSLTRVGYGGECLTEHWVNYLGLTAIVVGTLVAITVGMATDRIKGRMKVTNHSPAWPGLTPDWLQVTILGLLTAGGVMFTLLTLISLEVVVFSNMTLLKVTCQHGGNT